MTKETGWLGQLISASLSSATQSLNNGVGTVAVMVAMHGPISKGFADVHIDMAKCLTFQQQRPTPSLQCGTISWGYQSVSCCQNDYIWPLPFEKVNCSFWHTCQVWICLYRPTGLSQHHCLRVHRASDLPTYAKFLVPWGEVTEGHREAWSVTSIDMSLHLQTRGIRNK